MRWTEYEQLTDETIEDLTGEKRDGSEADWVHRSLTAAYPHLLPFTMDEFKESRPVEIDDSLWHASLERMTSTMETQALAGRNVAVRLPLSLVR